MTYARRAWAVLWKDLMIEGRSKETLNALVFFALLLLFLFEFALGGDRQRLAAARHLLPVLVLMVCVIGSIYAGLATATEAAIIGVVGALAIAATSGNLTAATFWESAMSAMRTSTMIAFILAGSSFMTVAVGFLGIPDVRSVEQMIRSRVHQQQAA